MRYGFVLPGGSAKEQVEQAVLAEAAGWDGVFVWEGAYGIDAWALLAAMAERTSRVRLGTMLTALPWRRPWKVASQAVTVDELSEGRVILSVGLGYESSGIGDRRDVTDRRGRADLLDEGLDILDALWTGQLEHEGPRYRLEIAPGHVYDARPVQQPRIPIWVVGAWPRPKSMARVLRCDGLLPVVMEGGRFRRMTPDHIRAIRVWLEEHGTDLSRFDIVVEGETPADDLDAGAEIVRPWMEAGATWWIDARWELPHHSEERMNAVRARLEAGPPEVTGGSGMRDG